MLLLIQEQKDLLAEVGLGTDVKQDHYIRIEIHNKKIPNNLLNKQVME